MKIIFEYDTTLGAKKRVEIHTDAEDIFDVLDEIKNALISYGFHPDTVKTGFLERAKEYKLEEEIDKKAKGGE